VGDVNKDRKDLSVEVNYYLQKISAILLHEIYDVIIFILKFVHMTVLWGSRPSRLSIYIEVQYLYNVRARYSIRFCHRQICELKFPPFRGTICNILDWIPAPFGKSRWSFFAILRFIRPKTRLHIGKTRMLHLRHQINTFSASLFTRMRAHVIIAFITI